MFQVSYTIGEVAAICRMSATTIRRCFDDGTLGGFRVPGSRFRRVPLGDLQEFMRKFSVPADLIAQTARPKSRRRIVYVLVARHTDGFVAAVISRRLAEECLAHMPDAAAYRVVMHQLDQSSREFAVKSCSFLSKRIASIVPITESSA